MHQPWSIGALLAFRRLQKAKDIGADFAKRAPLLS
jgi:hypothetical protein